MTTALDQNIFRLQIPVNNTCVQTNVATRYQNHQLKVHYLEENVADMHVKHV